MLRIRSALARSPGGSRTTMGVSVSALPYTVPTLRPPTAATTASTSEAFIP